MMKSKIGIGLFICVALMITGCASSGTNNIDDGILVIDPFVQSNTEFAMQFERCKNDLSKCDLDRDGNFEGTITRINDGERSNGLANTIEVDAGEDYYMVHTNPHILLVNQQGEILENPTQLKKGMKVQVREKSIVRVDKGRIIELFGSYKIIQEILE